MNASNQGPLYALALVRGLHKVLSVVAHTDEGGIHRDLLRCGGFGVPFGGIHLGLHEYSGLPAPATDSATEMAAFCDSLVLKSAALVAHCDPGVRFEGEWFPTFFLGTDTTTAYAQPGTNLEGTAAMAAINRSRVVNEYGRFLELYVPALGKLFAAEGDSSIGVRFQTAMAHNLDADTRHLRFASVTPNYWIEPTSLIPHNFIGSEAEQQGFASIGGKHSWRNLPAWESIRKVDAGHPLMTSYVVKMRSARTSGFLLHWQGHPMNGLARIIPKQLDPTKVIHPGSGPLNNNVADRVLTGSDITQYLWTRGQCPFPAPGELINLKPYYGITARHGTMDDEGYPTDEHLPNHLEFEHTQVDIAVSLPTGLPTGAANAWDSTARRAKTRAACSLATAINRVRVFGRADVNEMTMSLCCSYE
ncbi:Major capsid protein [Podosphaera aphanis]|nr:Major capsid protein [Podosphaera aphanis]